ncbi:MAG: PhoPQ-activated pathogenicity [Verrucomicrobia bacterium]|nr:PhoPQ-activated pathogenicity [Verrucomicrobiota bacterium]
MKLTLPRRLPNSIRGLALFAALVACSSPHLAAASKTPYRSSETALDRYVRTPDASYRHQRVKTHEGPGFKAHVLEMTSQTWLTTNEVDRPEWKHWLTIIQPAEVKSQKALLFIEGGGNGPNPPKSPDEKIAQIALRTKSVTAQLRMVPNQPLVFAGETEKRSEDSMIAYTWDKFLRTGDEKWPARLPMTKSAVRAMDAVSEYCATAEGGGVQIDGFVIAGGSKRGWTTWTAAAVDKRVVGVIPFVIDVLNMEPSMQHHYASYGFWAPAVGDYEAQGIMNWMGTPEMKALLKIEEPYEYRDRLTMPKFIVNSAGDQFFLPDSARFYFDDLPGTKYLRYVPNSDHGLKNTDALLTLLACYDAVIYNRPLPQFTWNHPRAGEVKVRTQTRPSEVKLWTATNPKARDFRLDTLGPLYQSQPLSDQGNGSYAAKVAKPESGFTAYFVELTFPNETQPFKFTTDVRVVPDVAPHRWVPKPVR